MNEAPGALQSRDPASAAAEVDSHHPLHVVADFVSFATTFFASSLIHFVAPPFKIKTARPLLGLVDNFGLSLCQVLILFRMGLLFFYPGGSRTGAGVNEALPFLRCG